MVKEIYPKEINDYYQSNCCKDKIKIETVGLSTIRRYYICSKCNNPCKVEPKETTNAKRD